MLDQLIFGLNNYFLSHLLFLTHWTKVLTPYPVAPDGRIPLFLSVQQVPAMSI